MKNQLFNRKILFSLLAVVMCLGWTAMSYGAATVSVDPATMDSPAVGEQFTVNINIAGGAGVAGFQATVNYDKTALSYVSAAKGDYLPGDPAAGTFFPLLRPGDSHVVIGGTSIGVGTGDGDGTLATVTFEVVEVKASAITLSDVLVSDASANSLEVTTADGSITVPAPPEPDPVYGVMLAGVGNLTAETLDASEGVSYTLKVTNTGDTDDTIVLSSSAEVGIEGSVLGSFSQSDDQVPMAQLEIMLAAGASADVTFKVAGDSFTQPGEYGIKVTATSQGDATKTAEVSTTTTISKPVVPEPPPDPEPIPVVPEPQMFKITLTNLTTGAPGMGGQIFSPPIFATHAAGVKVYEVGQPANQALVLLAENGDTSGLAALATAAGANVEALTPPTGFVVPGASVSVVLTADAMNSSLSLATMLVSTNDAFIGVADLALFDAEGMPVSITRNLMAYDAGSEQNTERGTDIPGPVGLAPADDPEGSNARVPTEGGVITPHPGIMEVGDVAASFAWTEPTAMLTIEPYVPEPEPVLPPPLPTYDIMLQAGLNLISIPLMPTEPYTAKSLAEMVGSTVVIKLDAAAQDFVGYVVAEDDDGFAIEGGKGYIVNTPAGGMITFSGNAWSNAPAEMTEMPMEEAAAAPKLSTAKDAWAFVITSGLQDEITGASYTMVAKNLRTGVVTTKKATSDKGRASAVWVDMSYKSVVAAGDKIEITLVDENGTIVSGPFERTVQTSDVNNAYLSVQMRVGDVRPKETILGQNFPNPFNPETWIPYQLSRDSNVTIQIYNVSGHTVRTLNLGHKSTGSYMTSSAAAYWDGKNDAGEHVASGIYFYALQTENFSATRRMVILK